MSGHIQPVVDTAVSTPSVFMVHAPDVYAALEARIRENGGFEPDGKDKA